MMKYKSIYHEQVQKRRNELLELFSKKAAPKGSISGSDSSGFTKQFILNKDTPDQIVVRVQLSGLRLESSDPNNTFLMSTISFKTGKNAKGLTYSNTGDKQQFKVFPSVFAVVNEIYESKIAPSVCYFTFAGVNPTPKAAKKAKRVTSDFFDKHKFYILFKKQDLDRLCAQVTDINLILQSNYNRADIDSPSDIYKKMLMFGLEQEVEESLKPSLLQALESKRFLLVNHTLEEFRIPADVVSEELAEEKQIGIHCTNFEDLIRIKKWMMDNELLVVADNLPSQRDIEKGNQRNNIYIQGAIKYGAENVYSAGSSIIVGSEPLPIGHRLRTNYKVEKETDIRSFEDPSFYNLDIQGKMEQYGCTLTKLIQIGRTYLKVKFKIRGKALFIDSFVFAVCLLSKYSKGIRFEKLKSANLQDIVFELIEGESIRLKIYSVRRNFLTLFPSDHKSPIFKKILTDLNQLKTSKDISAIKFFDTEQGFLNG